MSVATLVKKVLPRSVLERIRPPPQWLAISLRDPAKIAQVVLTNGNSAVDVTDNNVIASLRPLTVAFGMTDELREALRSDRTAQLRFFDRDTQRAVACLDLRFEELWSTAGASIGFYQIVRGRHSFVAWPRRSWNRMFYARAARAGTSPHNFSMSAAAIEQTTIFYTLPRPVVLVSIDDGRHSNIFPMDLIGPLAPDLFTLALRSTSQSIETMKQFRKVALSDVAAADYQIAYRLGAHHKSVAVDWKTLPFKIGRSRSYELPVPDLALRIRELDILEHRSIGSHTYFVCRVASDTAMRDGTRFHHTGGIHQHYRAKSRRALEVA